MCKRSDGRMFESRVASPGARQPRSRVRGEVIEEKLLRVFYQPVATKHGVGEYRFVRLQKGPAFARVVAVVTTAIAVVADRCHLVARQDALRHFFDAGAARTRCSCI